MIDKYKHIREFDGYVKLLKTGMFWEFHPELSGIWLDDIKIIEEYYR